MPEALVISRLSPHEFGRYLAIGAESRKRGEAVFVEVDPETLRKDFDLESFEEKCQPRPDGRPHRSSYVAVYRALERIPRSALGTLYLVARDGTCLEIHQTEASPPDSDGRFHLYQEFCPISAQVVSRLEPIAFTRFMTSPDQPVFVPRLFFAELELGNLATDPDGPTRNLPYPALEHIRYCLSELQKLPGKQTKIVRRELLNDVPFWMIRGGIYAGDASGVVAYPMPTEEELRRSNFAWWSSARAVGVL